MSSLIRKSISKAVAGSGIMFKNYITVTFSIDNPIIDRVTSVGEVKVRSIYHGVRKTVKYPAMTDTQINIQADANTPIMLVGEFIEFDVVVEGDSVNHHLTSIIFKKQESLTILEVGAIASGVQEEISVIDLSGLVNLEVLDVNGTSISYLDLSKNTKLKQLEAKALHTMDSIDISNCPYIENVDLSYTSLPGGLIGLQNKTNLLKLEAGGNSVISSIFDTTGCTSLKRLSVTLGEGISSINLPDSLKEIVLSSTLITEITHYGNLDFAQIRCQNAKRINLPNSALGNFSQFYTTPQLNYLCAYYMDQGYTHLIESINSSTTTGTIRLKREGSVTWNTHRYEIVNAATTKGWVVEDYD